MLGVRFRVLGDIEVLVDGRAVDIGHARPRGVLAVLLIEANRVVAIDRLVDRVWGRVRAPADPRGVLRTYLSGLRRALAGAPGVALVRQSPGYKLVVDSRDADIHRFGDLLAQARAAADEDDRAIALFEQALGLWRGEPFAGLDTPWINTTRHNLLAQRHAARLDLVDLQLRRGRHAALLTQLTDLADSHPLDERVAGQLMLALYRAGRQADALAHYRRIRTLLTDELGADPGAALHHLHQQILTHHPALAPSVPTGQAITSTSMPTVPAGPQTRRHLPAAPAMFTGRADELARLLALASGTETERRFGAVVISAIDGMAGVGKTTLALYAGHHLAEHFPDGQLFLDLHGYTQGLSPRDPGDALATLLQWLGLPPERIPPELEARAAVYRDRLAGTRTLIVLDNAANEAQVRPLLPGTDTCLMLITSRRRLKALDDTHVLPLDVLPLTDALTLLRRIATPAPGDADHTDDAVLEEIAHLCGCLPLALRIAAALIRHRPAWNLRHLADTLRRHQPKLEGFADGDRDLAAVFDLSYHTLTDAQRHLFRLLGLVPGPDIDTYAAAALLDADPVTATRRLQDLVDHNLLAEPTPGRYQLHDLLRLYVRALALRDPTDLRTAALDRLLNYYQHTANRADSHIARHTRPGRAGPAPTHTPSLPHPDTAWTWLRAERVNLLACLDHAARDGRGDTVIALTSGLATLLRSDGPWLQALDMHTAALTAARHLDDRHSQAAALTHLGVIRRLTGDYPGAARDPRDALQLYRDLGDRYGQSSAHVELGIIRWVTGDHLGAIRDLETALHLCRDLGDRRGQAGAHTDLGAVRRTTGDLPGAARDLETALRLYRELGDRRGQADALTFLGNVRRLSGDLGGAIRDLETALRLHRDLGDRRGQANALRELGTARRGTGDHLGAIADLEAALRLDHDLGDRHGRAATQTELGTTRLAIDDRLAAVRDLEAALELFREIGARSGEARASTRYADAVAATGDLARALALHRDALHLAREVHQPDDEAHALEGIGQCLLRQGDPHAATAHLAQALDIFERLRMRPDAHRIRTQLKELRRQPRPRSTMRSEQPFSAAP